MKHGPAQQTSHSSPRGGVPAVALWLGALGGLGLLFGATPSLAVPALSSLSRSPSIITGGCETSTLTVTLSEAAPAGGSVVTLSSNRSDVFVPAQVTVPAGATTTTTTVSADETTSWITGTISGQLGVTKSTSIDVAPNGIDFAPSGLSLNPSSVPGGAPSTGTVKLFCPASAGGVTVQLGSSNSATAVVPASIVVPAGSDSVTFTVSTSAVSWQSSVSISASYDETRSVSLSVLPPAVVDAIALADAVIIGGSPSSGTVTLDQPAPSGGVVVTLTSTAPSVLTVPATVTVAAGELEATFVATTTAVSALVALSVDASLGGGPAEWFDVAVRPIGVQSVSLDPQAILSMSSAIGTLTLERPAGPGDITVYLSSNHYGVASPTPPSIVVPAGEQGGQFYVVSGPVSSASTTNVIATRGASTASVSAAISVTPRPTDSVCADPAQELCQQCMQPHLELTTGPTASPTSTEECLCRPAVFRVPETIPVLSGNAGNAEARLLFQDQYWATVDCLYRGGASTSSPTQADDILRGETFHLIYCEARDAGDEVPGLGILFEVAGGAPEFGPLHTAVDLVEDGEFPPQVTINGVAEGAIVADTVTLDVQVQDGIVTAMTLNGAPFSGTEVTAEGEHVLEVQAGCGSAQSQLTRHFTIDRTPPAITINGVTDQELRTTAATITVSVTDAHPGTFISVLDGVPFSGPLVVDTEGSHTLIVTAQDAAGNDAAVQLVFVIDQTAPALIIEAPADGADTLQDDILFVATASDDHGIATVRIGGDVVSQDPDLRYRRLVPLAVGDNLITVEAVDVAGNTTTSGRNVHRDVEQPDAGFADAGFEDAGFVDAGFADAGFADAGFADAGFADAGFSPPLVVIDAPTEGLLTNANAVVLSGHVDDGTAPLTVRVDGVNIALSEGAFSTVVALAEGEQTLTVVATDAEARTDTKTRTIVIDKTAPHLTVSSPADAAVVQVSPLLVEGIAGDIHLAEVTVNGEVVVVVAGAFSVPVPLVPGENTVYVRATDGAGNVTLLQRSVLFESNAPTVAVRLPLENAELTTSPVRVEAVVTSTSPVGVLMNGVVATDLGGVYAADVPLVPGANVLTVVATDENDLVGTATVSVRYRNVDEEPLRIVSVSPAPDATGVEPDAVVTVRFNKPIAAQDLGGRLTLTVDGEDLTIGFYTSPDGASASLIAREALPEAALIEVQAQGLLAAQGPSQADVFSSDFTVRRPLTGVVGVVLDEDLVPVRGAQVVIDGTSLKADVGSDGHFGFFDVPAGVYRVTVTGGADDGGTLSEIRPRVIVEGEHTTRLRPFFLTTIDQAAAQYIDGNDAVDATFLGKSNGLRVQAPAGSLQLKTGRARGTLTVTPLPVELSPYPVEGHLGAPLLWQLQPQGTRILRNGQIWLPNATGLPPGRSVLVLVSDENRAELTWRGLGHVSADGAVIVPDDEIAGLIDVFGYLPLSVEQEQRVVAALAGGGPQGAFLDTIFDLLSINKAHAQFLGALQPATDALFALTTEAAVTGHVKLVQREVVSITSTPPTSTSVTLHYTLTAVGGTEPYAFSLQGARPTGMTIDAASGLLTFTPAAGQTAITIDVVATDAAGRVAKQTLALTPVLVASQTQVRAAVSSTTTSDDVNGELLELPGVLVRLGVSGLAGTTGPSGGFGFPVPTYGGEMTEVAIAEMPLGTFPVVRKDAQGAFRTERVWTTHYARSPILPLFNDTTMRTVILVDATVLRGIVRFVDDDGAATLVPVEGGETAWDPATSRLLAISTADVATTEVHFFKEGDLDKSIARFSIVAEDGAFARLRIGPRDLTHQERRRQGQQLDDRVLRAGERVVMFAVNHATGYAGMTTVEVPSGPSASGPPVVFGTIKLFPPEIEINVERATRPRGVPQPMAPSKIRSGGMATTSDDYVSVSTRWRVRLKPNEADDVDAGVIADAGTLVSDLDAGFLDGGFVNDAGVDGGPGGFGRLAALVDEGAAGSPLERSCAEVSGDATAREKVDCLQRSDVLVDVPAGISPLAGHIVSLNGAAAIEHAAFVVKPGPSTSSLAIARRIEGESVLPLSAGLYLTHVVGRQVIERDIDGDGRLSISELNAPPPDFTEDAALRGFPKNAVALKGVYTASLRPESGGAVRRIPSFDRTRESTFRVASIASARVDATSGVAVRELEQGDTRASAELDDDGYLLSLLLDDPGKAERPVQRDDLEVRLGGDVLGVECRLDRSGNALSASCNGEDVIDVVSALDVIYIELFESGNADNVLYRYNFYGLSDRIDQASATTKTTYDRAQRLDTGTLARLNRSPHTKPNIAVFPISIEDLVQGGTIEIRADDRVIRSIDVTASPFSWVARSTDTWKAPVEIIGVNGTLIYVQLPLPPSEVSLATPEEAPVISAAIWPVGQPAATVVGIARPRARIESRAALSPGHMQFHGVDAFDGHLTFTEVDLDVPEYGSRVTFARTYNNQNHEVTALGAGWWHNHEGFVDEERSPVDGQPGRYSVVLGGQQLTFPECQYDAICSSDKSLDAELTVTRVGQSFTAHLDNHESGNKIDFLQPSVGPEREGLRRTLLTKVDDGFLGDVIYEYLPGSDNLDVVYRAGGLLRLQFAYEDIDLDDQKLHAAVRRAAVVKRYRRLREVRIERGATVIDQLLFVHDLPSSPTPGCSTAPVLLTQANVGLLTDVCRPMRAPAPHWRYAYKAHPTERLKPTPLLLLANEIETRELLVDDEQPLRTWTYLREATPANKPQPHLNLFEMVTAVKEPGAGLFAEIQFTSAMVRTLVTPEGQVPHKVSFNSYGSAADVERDGVGHLRTFENDDEGEKVAQAERVLSTLEMSLSGDLTDNVFASVRHRTEQVTTTMGSSSSETTAGLPGGALTVATPEREARFGTPTQMTFPGGNGVSTTADLTVAPWGGVTGMSIPTSTTPVGFSLQTNDRGVPQTGNDLDGNDLAYSGADEFGQPVLLVTSRGATVAPGALATVAREFGYDSLGRLVSVVEVETGRGSSWELDALGRETERRTIVGDSLNEELVETAYETTASTHTVTTLLGGVLRRIESWDADRRLDLVEVPLAGVTESIDYAYRSDGLLDFVKSTRRDEERKLAYIGAGKFLHTTTTTNADGSAVETRNLDSEGNLLTSTSRDHLGRTTTTTYDKLGRAVKVSYGKAGGKPGAGDDEESFKLDVQGNVVEQHLGNGHIYTLDLDQAGRVLRRFSTSSTDVDDHFAHDGSGRMTSSQRKPSDVEETFAYDDVLGRMTSHETTIRTVNEAGQAQALSSTETRIYVDANREVRFRQETETLDGTLRVKTWRVFFDGLDRPVRVEDDLPEGGPHVLSTDYFPDRLTELRRDESTGLVTTALFDPQGHLLSTQNAEQQMEQTVDVAGAVTHRETHGPRSDVHWVEDWNRFSEPVNKTLLAAATLPAMTTTWTYDPTTQTTTEHPPTDASGGAASIEQVTNARGLLLRETQGPQTTLFTYDGEQLEEAERTEGASTTTKTMVWDDAGRVRVARERWQSGGLSYDYTTTTDYEGRAATVSDHWLTGELVVNRSASIITDSFGNVALHKQMNVDALSIVDAAGRPLFEKGPSLLPRRHEFAQGLLTSSTQGDETSTLHYDMAGRARLSTDPLGHTVETQYTPMGIPSSRTTTAFTTTTEAFDAAGFLQTRTVGAGGTTPTATWTFQMGPQGEIARVTLPQESGRPLEEYVTTYTSDRKILELDSPGGAHRINAYADSLRRPTLQMRGGMRWETTWDADGNSTTSNLLNETETVLTDGRGRAARKSFAGAAGLTQVTSFYDGVDQPLKIDEVDFGTTTTTAYHYDDRNRVLDILRGGSPAVHHSYIDGPTLERTRQVGDLGAVERKFFDGLGRVARIEGGPGGRTLALDYETGGLPSTIRADGALFEERHYEPITKQLQSIALTSTTAVNIAYAYDSRGNRLTETINGEETKYRYDLADRLHGVRYPDGTTELYDLRGDGARRGRKVLGNGPTTIGAFDDVVQAPANLAQHQTYLFDGNDGLLGIRDELTSSTTPAVTDAAGRVRQIGLRTFTWDAADRLVSTSTPSSTSTYRYDYQGWRIRTQEPENDRSYVWGASGVEAEGATGVDPDVHTSAGGLTLGVGGELFGHDGLGSVVLRVPTASASKRVAFDAWGSVRSTPATGPPLGGSGDRVGFTGHANEDTGLVYAQQRWLDPTTGRFLSLDPVAGALAEPLSTQGWTYANANPTRFTDPDGRCSFRTGGDDVVRWSCSEDFKEGIGYAVAAFDADATARGDYADQARAGVLRTLLLPFAVATLAADVVVAPVVNFASISISIHKNPTADKVDELFLNGLMVATAFGNPAGKVAALDSAIARRGEATVSSGLTMESIGARTWPTGRPTPTAETPDGAIALVRQRVAASKAALADKLGMRVNSPVVASAADDTLAIGGQRVEILPDDEMVTLYRGVHDTSPQFAQAQNGVTVPQGGHTDPIMHNYGDTKSVFTSWSDSASMAEIFATRKGPGYSPSGSGVVLEVSIPRRYLTRSPDYSAEGESLIEGIVSGARSRRVTAVP